ncbi:MAG: PEP-CTERM sorting domain-containing protein [Desulfuromonadaceae bacterium]|nr:PEP-CTERM sorting domain-containing protein [Desulfuromonadaceae bacterium]MDD5107153.1 PEP-CTERM sorting domain-containing protein [Desulfuromonadaceae bacterium]
MKKHIISCVTLVLSLYFSSAYATQYGGVEFPGGVSSFADQVISFTPGPHTTAPYNNPLGALGAPNYTTVDDPSTYVSLGWGGTLVLKFTDNSLTTSGNNNYDLWIFEIGPAVEATNVSISKNGTDWISVGQVAGATRGVDIDAFIGSSGVTLWDQYSYIKLIDANAHLSSDPWGGADIDAVGAISSAAPVETPAVPEPGTIALLGLGMAGLAVYGKRRKNNKA